MSTRAPLLSVENLSVTFDTDAGPVQALDRVSYAVDSGKTLAIVGAPGSGKSVCSLTTLGLTRGPAARIEGKIIFAGKDLVAMSDRELRKIRGDEIAMIFQDALSSLHPLYKIGSQLTEAVLVHRSVSRSAARDRAIDMLELVGIPEPHRRIDQYPHQFSAGMRQRTLIAMALINEPELVIVDEPTTALDATAQAQILALLADLQRRLGVAIIITAHDAGAIAGIADQVCVMDAGRIVGHGSSQTRSARPQHPPIGGLLRSTPPSDVDHEPMPLIEVRNLVKHFPSARRTLFGRQLAAVKAVDDVSFNVIGGETLGIVGEIGSGKSTIARLLCRLLDPTSGQLIVNGEDVSTLQGDARKNLHRQVQMIFRDPYSSLNPRKRVGSIIADPFAIHGTCPDEAERNRTVNELMERVGLNPEHSNRYPREFSVEQRQRIAVARAIALEPSVLIVDESVSALEISIQAQLLDLLRGLQRDLGLTLILIARDLSTVRHICDRLVVMHLGKIVEAAPSAPLRKG